MRIIRLVAIAWVVATLAMLAIHVLLPQRSGFLALTQVFQPYIVLTGLLAGIVAFRTPGLAAKLLVVALVVASVALYVPSWVSIPNASAAGGDSLHVSAWNVEGGPEGAARTLEGIEGLNVDIVGIEELQEPMAKALATDPAILANLPHQILMHDQETLGAGLISRYPILEQSGSMYPTYIRAVIQLPSGRQITVFVVHPRPPDLGLRIGMDSAKRDFDLELVRGLIDADLAHGHDVIVLGDMNTTDREPAYDDISQGLRDSHLDAGIGPGLTWRPDDLKTVPFGLLRIDYVFATTDFSFQSSSVDCRLPSDHCRIDATLSLSGAT